MTYREYLEGCGEFEKTVIIVNLARKCPNYELLSPRARERAVKDLLDSEMPEGDKEGKI